MLRVILIVLILCSTAFAGQGMGPGPGTGKGGAASCTSPGSLLAQGSSDGNLNINTVCGAGAQFTNAAQWTLTSYTVYLYHIGGGEATVHCSVFNDSAGVPTTEVANSRVDLTTTMNAAWTGHVFTLSNQLVLPPGSYQLVCHSDTTSVVWGHTATGGNSSLPSGGTYPSCTGWAAGSLLRYMALTGCD